MKKILYSMALVSNILLAQTAFAAGSVYYCDETGAYGYSWDASTVAEAKKLALKACKDSEGTNCEELLSSDDGGYGAIAIGKDADGVEVVGAVLSAETSKEAEKGSIAAAKKAGAKSPKIHEKWNDKQ